MTRWKLLPIFLSALLCTASCNLGTSPGGGGTEGEGLSGRLQDPGGRPTAGVLVRVFPEAHASIGKTAAVAEAIFDSVYTDSRGFFTFDSLPAGNYGLRTYIKRGDTTLALMVRQIYYPGGKKSLGTRTLVVGGKITVHVHSGTTPSGEHQHLPGTECSVLGVPYVSLTDESGLCVIDALPPGQYAVLLSHPGYEDVITVPIEVRPGQSSDHGAWQLPPSGQTRRYPAGSSTLAHWTFDARDSITGEFPDVSGHPIPLQTHGTVPLVASPFGKAAAFNGSSYLQAVGNTSGLSGVNERYLTLEARVRMTQYPFPVNRDSSSAVLGAERGYTLLVRSNGAIAVASPGDGRTTWQLGAAWSRPGAVPLNQWVDLAVSIDKEKLLAYAFVNGAPVQLFNGNGGYFPNLPEASRPFHVGLIPETNRPFIGEIDEARVSDSLVLGVGLPMARSDSVSPYPSVQSYAVADAVISSAVPGNPDVNDLNDLNHGAVTGFGVGTYDMNNSGRILLRFALPGGIAPAQISRAVIRMRTYAWFAKNVQGNVRINAHKVLRPWREGTGLGAGYYNSASINGVTARDRFWTNDGSAAWNQVLVGLDGVDASASPASSAFHPAQSTAIWEWDVTELVRQWAADTSQNFGVLLASAFPTGNGSVRDYPIFHTREVGADSLKPTLLINGPPVAEPQTAEFRSTADADVTISSSVPGNPDNNGFGPMNRGKELAFGAATYDMAGASRALVRFHVPGQYSAGRIISAKIRFSPSGWTPKNAQRPYQIKIHRMLKSWKEGSAASITRNSATIDGVTAQERFWGSQNGSEDWSEVLVGRNNIDASSTVTDSLTKPSGSMDAWEFDVTSLARQWAADTTSNFGILMDSPFPQTNAQVWDYPLFHSREAAVPDSLKPTLRLKVLPYPLDD